MVWYLYITQNANGAFYTGITNNLEKRLKEHFEGKGGRYTRRNRPERLLYTEQFDSRDKAEALLIEQINPEVEKFKAEINSQIEEIRSIVAKIETLKSQSDSNAKQIEKALSFARSSEREIEKFKKAISGLQSDLVKINRGLVEIQYFSVKGANRGPNRYRERIQKTLNEIIAIAIPDSKERSKFVQELNAYQFKEE